MKYIQFNLCVWATNIQYSMSINYFYTSAMGFSEAAVGAGFWNGFAFFLSVCITGFIQT